MHYKCDKLETIEKSNTSKKLGQKEKSLLLNSFTCSQIGEGFTHLEYPRHPRYPRYESLEMHEEVRECHYMSLQLFLKLLQILYKLFSRTILSGFALHTPSNIY